MIVRPRPWREVECGDTVLDPAGRMVVAPGPWSGDGAASVVLVDEHEAAAALRAAGFTWELIEETS